MQTVAVARHAMATRFEIVLHGENPVALRAAGEEALDEIERIEAQLSLYRPTSEIAQLNACAAREPVKVTPALFALLQQAQRLHEETADAFDITIGPLVRCWGFMGGSGRMPTAEEISEARTKVGMHLVQLNAINHTVQFARDGVMLDLGAIGKGYAVERAAEVLRQAGVTSALIHGGTSTVYALGQPPDAVCWKIAIESPPVGALRSACRRSAERASPEGGTTNPLPAVLLRDEAMSVSAIWGRSFQTGGQTFGHVIDSRTGWPVTGALLAAVVLPSATETDALSTALLVLGSAGRKQLVHRPMRTLLAVTLANTDGFRLEGDGIAAC